jgi:hypothetical protein
MWCWTAHAHSMKRTLTQYSSANSLIGRSERLTTRSDPEATGTGHPHVTTTITAATTDVSTRITIAVTTGDVTTSSRKAAVMSVTFLPYRRQATPTAHSNRPRGRST